MFIGVFLFFLGVFLILFYSAHYIVLLFSVEYLLLGVFVCLFFDFWGLAGLQGAFLFILILVCMGGFSISLLLAASRFFGRDFWLFKFIF